MFLASCFQPSWSVAQQDSGASSTAQAAGQTAGVKEPGGQDAARARQEKSSGNGSQPADDAKVPQLPGAIVQVLKEGEKLPQRKNEKYEDWRRPDLKPGVTMKMSAVKLATGKGDGFTREIWSVQWRELDPIDLWVIRPEGIKKPPVILYLYSYDGSNERYRNDDFCKFVTRDGFAAVGFVSALTEQRFHDRPTVQTFVSELQESLGTTTHDVQMILNYMEKRGDLDMNRVGMWADGSGAGIAIMASAVDDRIKTLDLLDPWGDWPDWMEQSSLLPEGKRPDYLTPFFQLQVIDLDPLKYFPKVKAKKVRLQYIKDGISVTPPTVREKMEAAAPPQTEIVHYASKTAFLSEVAAKGIGFDWIKANVSSPQRETRDRATATLGDKQSEPQ